LGSVQSAIDWFKEPVTRAELDAAHIEAGYGKVSPKTWKAIQHTSEAATGQSETVPRVFAFGNKAGAYTLNHLGDFRYNTTDIWESRFIRSYFPALFEKATGLPLPAEHDLFSRFAKDFKVAWEKKNGPTDNAGLQALRWYFVLAKARELGYRYARTSETISKYAENYYAKVSGNDSGQLGLGLDETRAGQDAGQAAGQEAGAPAPAVTFHAQPQADGEIGRIESGRRPRTGPTSLTPEEAARTVKEFSDHIPELPGMPAPEAAKSPSGSSAWVSLHTDGTRALKVDPLILERDIHESMAAGHSRAEALRTIADEELKHWGDNTPIPVAAQHGEEILRDMPEFAKEVAQRYKHENATDAERAAFLGEGLTGVDRQKAMAGFSYEALHYAQNLADNGKFTRQMYEKMPVGFIARLIAALKRRFEAWHGKDILNKMSPDLQERVKRIGLMNDLLQTSRLGPRPLKMRLRDCPRAAKCRLRQLSTSVSTPTTARASLVKRLGPRLKNTVSQFCGRALSRAARSPPPS
jgi:hypothetical protein